MTFISSPMLRPMYLSKKALFLEEFLKNWGIKILELSMTQKGENYPTYEMFGNQNGEKKFSIIIYKCKNKMK